MACAPPGACVIVREVVYISTVGISARLVRHGTRSTRSLRSSTDHPSGRAPVERRAHGLTRIRQIAEPRPSGAAGTLAQSQPDGSDARGGISSVSISYGWK